MFEATITGIIYKFIFTLLVNIVLAALFVGIYSVVIKLKKADWFNAIIFRQNFIAFSVSIYIFALLPVYLSWFVWLLTFVFLRECFFRKDETRMYQLYSKYGKYTGDPYPGILKLSQFKEAFFSVDKTNRRYKDFKYSFLSFSNTGVWLILFLLLKVVQTTTTVNLLYFAEIIIIASVIFIFIGRLVYHCSFYGSSYGFFGDKIGSFMLVILVGLVYYTAIVSILFGIYGTELFRI